MGRVRDLPRSILDGRNFWEHLECDNLTRKTWFGS